MEGQVIGNFTVVRLIGAGGMGEVYLAEQKDLGTRAAIKLLQTNVSRDRDHVTRFFNEARAVTRINHAGIVKISDAGYTAAGRAYFVMEMLEGETLSSVIARVRRLPLAQISELGRQIASVLAATHQHGITHRDLKPDNIFIVPDQELASGQRVKILDFGIAKLTGTLGQQSPGTTGTMGTPAYMAPEQWGNAANTDFRADMYSLGCVLFEMACGRPPFAGASYADFCAKHLTAQPPLVSSFAYELGPALDSLVACLLAKDPAQRGSGMKEIEHALEALGGASAPIFVAGAQAASATPATQQGGGRTIDRPAGPIAQLAPLPAAAPTPVSAPPPPAAKRSSALVGVGAIAVLVGAGVIGYVATRDDSKTPAGGSAIASGAMVAAVDPPKPDAAAATDPPPLYPCAEVGDHFAQLGDPTQVLQDIRDASREILVHHCTDDRWTTDQRRCFVVARNDADGSACLRALPEASSRGLDADYTAATTNLRRAWVTIEADKITLAHAIEFAPGTSDLSPLSLPVIRAVAEVLAAQPKLRLEIQGHADTMAGHEPAREHDLSLARALDVRDELVKDGVPVERLDAKAFGDTRPLDPTHSMQAMRVNNRIELHIVP